MARFPEIDELKVLFPEEILEPPQPVVFILSDQPNTPGSPTSLSLGERLKTALETCPPITGSAPHVEMPALKISILPLEHAFLPKKPLRDEGSRTAEGRPTEAYNINGLFKANWLPKHFGMLPGIVLLTLPFQSGLSVGRYADQEDIICRHVDRVRASLATRESKLILVLNRSSASMTPESPDSPPSPPPSIQSPNSGNATSSEIAEQRINDLRKRCGLDSKMVVILFDDLDDPIPFSGGTTLVHRLFRHVREFSHGYYLAQARRVKKWEKSLNKHTQQSLLVRYCFKIGYFYEFQENADKMLRYYRMAYDSLADLPEQKVIAVSGKNHGHSWPAQRKGLAEILAFKLVSCALLKSIPPTNSDDVAVSLMRRHLTTFRGVAPGDDPSLHLAWLARQHHIFGLLLELKRRKEGIYSVSAGVAAKSGFLDPHYYYDAAAALTIERRQIADSMKSRRLKRPSDFDTPSNATAVPPVFVGDFPTFATPVDANLPRRDFTLISLWNKEMGTDFLSLSTTFLSRAKSNLEFRAEKNGLKRHRKIAQLLSSLANENLCAHRYEDALDLFNTALVTDPGLVSAKWGPLSVDLLLKRMKCAEKLENHIELTDLSWRVLSSPYRPFVHPSVRLQTFAQLFQRLSSSTSSDACLEVEVNPAKELLKVSTRFKNINAEACTSSVLMIGVESFFPRPLHFQSIEFSFSGLAAPKKVVDVTGREVRDENNTKAFGTQRNENLVGDEVVGEVFDNSSDVRTRRRKSLSCNEKLFSSDLSLYIVPKKTLWFQVPLELFDPLDTASNVAIGIDSLSRSEGDPDMVPGEVWLSCTQARLVLQLPSPEPSKEVQFVVKCEAHKSNPGPSTMPRKELDLYVEHSSFKLSRGAHSLKKNDEQAAHLLDALKEPLGFSEILVQIPRATLKLRPLQPPPPIPRSISKQFETVKEDYHSRMASLSNLLVGALQPIILEFEIDDTDEFLDARLEVALSDAANTSTPTNCSNIPLPALSALPTEGVGGGSPLTTETAATAQTDPQIDENAVVVMAREAASRVAKTWNTFFWELTKQGEKSSFRPLSLMDNGQPSESYSLVSVEWKAKDEEKNKPRTARYALWVNPTRAGRVSLTCRVSYRPRAQHQWRVSSACAFEVRVFDPLDLNLSVRSESLQPCGLRGVTDLKDDPTYQRKVLQLSSNQTPTHSVGALSSILDQVSSIRNSVAGGERGADIALLANRRAVCVVTITNKQAQAIVLHRVMAHSHGPKLISVTGMKSNRLLSLLPLAQNHEVSRKQSVILNVGDCWTQKFYFPAPAASPGVDHSVDSCDPQQASQLASVACHWTRICDDPGVCQRRDFHIALPSPITDHIVEPESCHESLDESLWEPPSGSICATDRAFKQLDSLMNVDDNDELVSLPLPSLLAAVLKECPRVQAIRVPFRVKCEKPVAAAIGQPFEVTWTLTNLTRNFQEVSVSAHLPKPEIPSVGIGGAPLLGTTNAACYSHLGNDGRWIPYPPATCQRIASAIFANPRGGRIPLSDSTSTPAVSSTSSPPTSPTTPGHGSFEIRWGVSELRGVKLPSMFAEDSDSNDSANQIAQVNSSTGNARLVLKHSANSPPLSKSHSFGGMGGGIAGGLGGSASMLKATNSSSVLCTSNGGNDTDSFLWAGLKKGTVTIDPESGVEITYTMIPLRAGRLSLPQLDVYSAKLKSFVVHDSLSPPNSVFVSPLPGQIPGAGEAISP